MVISCALGNATVFDGFKSSDVRKIDICSRQIYSSASDSYYNYISKSYNLSKESNLFFIYCKNVETIGYCKFKDRVKMYSIFDCVELVFKELNRRLEAYTGKVTTNYDFSCIRPVEENVYTGNSKSDIPFVGSVIISYAWVNIVSKMLDASTPDSLFSLFSLIDLESGIDISKKRYKVNAIGLKTLETMYNMHMNGLIPYGM